jgi:hypothetical protein
MIVNVTKNGKKVGQVELGKEALLYAVLRSDLPEAARILEELRAELAKKLDPEQFDLALYVACPVCGMDRKVNPDGSITECAYCLMEGE